MGTTVQVVPRLWQGECLERYTRDATRGIKNWLAYVTPGGGKTWFAMEAARKLLDLREIRQVVVVVHTHNLRLQWQEQAPTHGLDLTDDVRRGNHDGFVVTYQRLADHPVWASRIAEVVKGNRRTLVIFDECHHMADTQSWGTQSGAAFKNCWRRLLLSGTPFRAGNDRIPFITYRDGEATADYTYGYARALADGIVPPVYFPTYGGDARWTIGDSEFRSRGEQDNKADQIRRLNTMIASANWLDTVLRSGADRLAELRVHQPDAAGLVVCRDQSHAREVAQRLSRLSGSVRLAVSDDSKAHDTIEDFRESSDEWLVAVRMVSEGVDIPRLRVGIYATNYRSELFFRQVVGRLTRLIAGYVDQSAFLYLPDHPDLVQYAQDMSVDRVHVLSEARRSGSGTNGRSVDATTFSGLGVSDVAAVKTLAAGAEFAPDELARAQQVRQVAGLGYLPLEVVASLLRAQASTISSGD